MKVVLWFVIVCNVLISVWREQQLQCDDECTDILLSPVETLFKEIWCNLPVVMQVIFSQSKKIWWRHFCFAVWSVLHSWMYNTDNYINFAVNQTFFFTVVNCVRRLWHANCLGTVCSFIGKLISLGESVCLFFMWFNKSPCPMYLACECEFHNGGELWKNAFSSSSLSIWIICVRVKEKVFFSPQLYNFFTVLQLLRTVVMDTSVR